LSPGAPRGARNGNFTDGTWTAEAIEERDSRQKRNAAGYLRSDQLVQTIQVGASRSSMTMSSNPTKASFTAAERVRLYRKRRREGMRYVRVLLSAPEIDSLVRMGLLRQERRRDPEALQDAVGALFDWALDDRTLSEKIARGLSPTTM
jgi:hypothetical protein